MNNQNGRNYLVFLTEIILTSRNLCISLLFLITEIGMETIDIILSKGKDDHRSTRFTYESPDH